MTANSTVIEAAKTAAAELIAEAEASVRTVPFLIEALKDHGISAGYIERALRLPFGSVKKWLAGEISPEELALLKIVCFFPRMLEVADADYDQSVASAALVATAGEMMLEEAKESAAKRKKEAAVVPETSEAPVTKDWVDALAPGDIFHEKNKRIQYTVVAINVGELRKLRISHGDNIVINVFPEFVRLRCTPGPIFDFGEMPVPDCSGCRLGPEMYSDWCRLACANHLRSELAIHVRCAKLASGCKPDTKEFYSEVADIIRAELDLRGEKHVGQ